MSPDPAPNNALGRCVVAEALTWIGTPYRCQASRKRVGCDCLGLVRGVWHAVYGFRLADPGAYAPDWAEVASTERLLDAARLYFLEKPEPARTEPGDLLLFRWRPHLSARHLGIMVDGSSFVHAYESAGGVVRSQLVSQWRRRIAAAFVFPSVPDRSI